MAYIDGFVFAVPTKNKQIFKEYAEKVDKLFIEHGAKQVIEAWGDDVPTGKTTDFYRAVKAKEDETVLFSWIFWPDKATRDAGNEKAFADMQKLDEDMTGTFDGKRMIYGGFEALVEL